MQSKEAKKIIWEFLDDGAKAMAKEEKSKLAKELKWLIHIEKQRGQSGHINTIVKLSGRGGPNSVLIPVITEYPCPGI